MKLLPFIFCLFFYSCSLFSEGKGNYTQIEVMIPMRDEALLPTSIYLPNSEGQKSEGTDAAEKKYPCVLIRQPLGKEHTNPAWVELVNAGYMVAVQSTRSSCDPEGKTLPYLSDGWGKLSDGYDTVEWLANCQWSNGKVGTIGESATGITQLLLAPTSAPNLACQYIEVACPSLYDYAVWPGGEYRQEQVDGWLKVHKSAKEVNHFLHEHREYNAFWDQFNALKVKDRVKSPQMHLGGWFDIFLQGTIDAYLAVAQDETLHHRLVIGPWEHRFKKLSTLGDFAALDEGKTPPYSISCKEWLDFHLKGENNSIASTPKIQYYVMGPFDNSSKAGNKWRSAHKWPPVAVIKNMHMAAKNSLQEIATELAPKQENIVYDVLFDAKDPVPTIGGRNLFIASGPRDLRPVEGRKDVVAFTTEKLAEDMEVTGRLNAHLFVSKVQKPRDVCLRLTDVYPDGRSVLIAEGLAHILPNKDQEPQEVVVDLWSTSMVFAKGHKMRLVVSGSNFPAYEASLEANEDESPICFRLHSGGKCASFLKLPVISDS